MQPNRGASASAQSLFPMFMRVSLSFWGPWDWPIDGLHPQPSAGGSKIANTYILWYGIRQRHGRTCRKQGSCLRGLLRGLFEANTPVLPAPCLRPAEHLHSLSLHLKKTTGMEVQPCTSSHAPEQEAASPGYTPVVRSICKDSSRRQAEKYRLPVNSAVPAA